MDGEAANKATNICWREFERRCRKSKTGKQSIRYASKTYLRQRQCGEMVYESKKKSMYRDCDRSL